MGEPLAVPPPPPDPVEIAKQEFKCGGCGANLQYSPGTSVLKCPFCGRENQLQVSAAPIVEHDLAELSLVPATDATGFGTATRQFKCDRCGATTTLVGASMATRCDFCASDVVVEAPPVAGMIRPESLVPFAFDKNAATRKFQAWLQGLWFRPGNLKRMAGLAQISGLYVPHFTYDANAFSQYTGEAGFYYNVTVGSGNNRRTERRVRWEHRSGTHQFFYDDELICASRGLPLKIMQKIYPYNLKGALVHYTPEYLSGFGAEAYTVDPREGWQMAGATMVNKEREACTRQIGGDTQRNVRVGTQLSNPKWKHVLLPAYVASYVFGANTFRFMVNGQTGEVQGEAPISWAKVGATVAVVVAAIVVITKLAGLW